MSGLNMKSFLAAKKASVKRDKQIADPRPAKKIKASVPSLEVESDSPIEKSSGVVLAEVSPPARPNSRKRDGKSILDDFVARQQRRKPNAAQVQVEKANGVQHKTVQNINTNLSPCALQISGNSRNSLENPTSQCDQRKNIKQLSAAKLEQPETISPPTKKGTRARNRSMTTDPDDIDDLKPAINSKPVTFQSPTINHTVAATPGFKKFAHLLPSHRSKLKLPDKYEVLNSILEALDHALIFCKGQNSSTLFVWLKRPVEHNCGRNFELKHLAQIKTVFPKAYKYQPVKTTHRGERVETLSIDFGDWQTASETSKQTPSEGGIARVLTGLQLDERKAILRDALVELVRNEHQRFIENLPESSRPAPELDRVLVSWHPLFDIEKVPDIAEADLPKIEKPIVDVAALLQNKGDLNSKIRSTLAKVSAKLNSQPIDEGASSHVRPKSAPVAQTAPGDTGDGSKSKVSTLLERIRAKEKKRNEMVMYSLSPEKIKRKTMLSRLPAITDSLSFLFFGAKKSVMYMPEIAQKLSESYKQPLSQAEVVEHINVLAEVAPAYIKLVSTDNGPMVKIDRQKTAKEVKQQIQIALNSL